MFSKKSSKDLAVGDRKMGFHGLQVQKDM